jgi:hypothetical protein
VTRYYETWLRIFNMIYGVAFQSLLPDVTLLLKNDFYISSLFEEV